MFLSFASVFPICSICEGTAGRLLIADCLFLYFSAETSTLLWSAVFVPIRLMNFSFYAKLSILEIAPRISLTFAVDIKESEQGKPAPLFRLT